MRKKYPLIVAVVLAVVIVVGGGVIWRSRLSEREGVSEVVVEPKKSEEADKEVMVRENTDNGSDVVDVAEEIDTSNWKVYENTVLQYRLKYPQTWRLDDSNPNRVELSRPDERSEVSAWITVEIQEKQPEVDLLSWIESSVPSLPPDREFLEVEDGSGWQFVGNAGPNTVIQSYLTENAADDSNVYKIVCTLMNALDNPLVKQECLGIIKYSELLEDGTSY
jgi:hypothetical protein